jgi:hypothetical protein
MAKQLVATEVPADEVDEIKEAFTALGATDVQATKQADDTFTVEGNFPD